MSPRMDDPYPAMREWARVELWGEPWSIRAIGHLLRRGHWPVQLSCMCVMRTVECFLCVRRHTCPPWNRPASGNLISDERYGQMLDAMTADAWSISPGWSVATPNRIDEKRLAAAMRAVEPYLRTYSFGSECGCGDGVCRGHDRRDEEAAAIAAAYRTSSADSGTDRGSGDAGEDSDRAQGG